MFSPVKRVFEIFPTDFSVYDFHLGKSFYRYQFPASYGETFTFGIVKNPAHVQKRLSLAGFLKAWTSPRRCGNGAAMEDFVSLALFF
jgi:hypothetical protein